MSTDTLAQLDSSTNRLEKSMQNLATKAEMNVMKTVSVTKMEDLKGELTNMRADFAKQFDSNAFFNSFQIKFKASLTETIHGHP